MKRFLSLLMAICMLVSVAGLALAEENNGQIPEAPAAREGEKVIDVWVITWQTWSQDWFNWQAYNWNAREDRPFYVNLQQYDGDTYATKLAAARASEGAPDIFVDNYANVILNYRNGYAQDLVGLIPQESIDDLLPSARQLVTLGDAIVAYPMMMEPSTVMYYDKDAFVEAGLDPDSPPTTWDELLEYAAALTTEDRFGMDIDIWYNMWSWTFTANGGTMLNDDWSAANMNNENMKEFAEFYWHIRNDGIASQTRLKDQNSGVYSVLEERAAISFSGSWGIYDIDAIYPEKRDRIGVAPAPSKDGIEPFHATTGGWCLQLDSKSDTPQEAAQFIHYMLGDAAENVAEYFVASNFSKFTARQSVSDYMIANTAVANDERIQTILTEIMPYVMAEPFYQWDITQFVNDMLTAIALEGKPVQEALDDCEKNINQFIADFGLAGTNPTMTQQ